MITVLLTILKVLGILLLVLLGILLLALFLVLFVPIRYTLEAKREEESEEPFSVKGRVTWLLHLLNIHACFPQTPYLRARILCFTVFSTEKKASEKPAQAEKEKEAVKPSGKKEKEQAAKKKEPTAPKEPAVLQEPVVLKEPAAAKEQAKKEEKEPDDEQAAKSAAYSEEYEDEAKEDAPSFLKFWKRIFSILQNIRYTIRQICDKIKYIVKNIRYYLEIIKSDTFRRAFGVCKGEIRKLLSSVRPRKIKGSILIGTGDPASTGQVFAIYGILYPFLGEQIAVTPDFERQVMAGELFVKGKITVFRLIKTAWIIYFNKDLRRIIKMFKREAA